MYTAQGMGMSKIAEHLYQNRVPTKKRKDGVINYTWSQTTIGRILSQRLYTGVLINNKQNNNPNLYEDERIDMPESEWIILERPEFRIISDKQFAEAQRLIDANKTKPPNEVVNNTRRSEAHILSNLLKCTGCGGGYRRYQRQHSTNGPMYYWWVCANRHAYGKKRCTHEYIRLEEEDVLSALSVLFDYLVDDRDSFFKLVEETCTTLIKEHIKQSGSVDISALEDELDTLSEQRERVKDMIKRGLLDIDEGETDMRELNLSIQRISAILNEQDLTDDLTARVKENLLAFFETFDRFSYREGLTNNALRSIVSKIDVINKGLLHVFFDVDDSVEGLFFPITIEGKMSDTESNNSTLWKTSVANVRQRFL